MCRSYLENTKAEDHYGYMKTKMGHLWSVDREGEAGRFKAHDGIENRKLLWHGTNGEFEAITHVPGWFTCMLFVGFPPRLWPVTAFQGPRDSFFAISLHVIGLSFASALSFLWRSCPS